MASFLRGATLPNIVPEFKSQEMFTFAQDWEESRQEASETCCPANLLQMSNIEHFCTGGTSHYLAMKTKELTAKQILSVPCPTCGAAIAEAFELHSGAPSRTELENFPRPRPWRRSSKRRQPGSRRRKPGETSSGQASNFDQISEGSE
jgi:hypothetical protein